MNRTLLYAMALLIGVQPAVAQTQTSDASPVVRIASGSIRGAAEGDISSFKGIPFAAPPTGAFRWRPPQPVQPWRDVREAKQFGADCAQAGFTPDAAPAMSPRSSEDCLYLNVWRPSSVQSGSKLPVMVWIYGGGFTGGSSSSPLTAGTEFAKHGVVLVAANYRVGRLGFFAFPELEREHLNEPKGNFAYMDEIAALRWVKQNIAAFGGDPNNVTIFGFSAGGVSVHSLMTMPAASGLFQKAIVESGGSRDSVLTARPMTKDGFDPNYPVSAETIGTTFAKSMGVEGTDEAALAKLRALSAAQIVQGAPGDHSYETTPILDGKLVTETAESAYKAHREPHIPLMLGSNSADTAGNRVRATSKEQLFARYGKWSDQAKAAYDPDGTKELPMVLAEANNDFGQAEPARFAARTFASDGSPVYLYRFSYVQGAMRDRLRTGTPHGGEIAFVFGTLGTPFFGPPPPPPSAEDKEVSRMAQSYWINFAKTGNPNGQGMPTWHQFEGW